MSLQPRKCPDVRSCGTHSWRPWHTEGPGHWAFPRSAWHCMTLPSTCVNSETATQCCARGDRTRAGDLGCCDLCGVSGWAPVQSGRCRAHWESLGCCSLELVWRVTGSKSHSASRAPLDHCRRPLCSGLCQGSTLRECSLTVSSRASPGHLLETQIPGSVRHLWDQNPWMWGFLQLPRCPNTPT